MYKYIAIIFPPDSQLVQDIVSISNSLLNEVEYEGVILITFESALTKNEVNAYLKQNSENRTFIISEIDNIKINLPDEVLEYLLNDKPLDEPIGSKTIFYFHNQEDLDNFEKTLTEYEVDYSTSNMVFKLEDVSITPQEYVDNLSTENKVSECERLLGILPNISDWEAEVLKLLMNE